MTLASRPLRALALVLGGWTAMRVVALWPIAGGAVEPPSADAARALTKPLVVTVPLDNDIALLAERPLSMRGMKMPRQAHGEAAVRRIANISLTPVAPIIGDDQIPPIAIRKQPERGLAVAPGFPVAIADSRFSGSAWALMRGDGAPSLASGGQLGGSQIGVRLFYKPGPAALAITARISAPLSGPRGREAAVGVALRGRNVGFIAEQRIALDKGGRDAPAVFAYGGVYDVALVAGLKLDGYAQAGVVGVRNPAAFVDGAVRVERTIINASKASLSIGAGAWGGAQPRVSRIDIGPQIVARTAVPQGNLRVSAEWRERVAGQAAPSSGPSVTVGFDF